MKTISLIVVACCYYINVFMLKDKLVGNYSMTRNELDSIIASSIAVGISAMSFLVLLLI